MKWILFSFAMILNLQSFAAKPVNVFRDSKMAQGEYALETLYEMDKISHNSGRAIINQNGQWKIQFRIGFIGAYYFALSSASEKKMLKKFLESQKEDIRYLPDASFFDLKSYTKNKKVSLAYHPKVKKIILQHVAAINKMFSTHRQSFGVDLQFEIIPVFIDEAALFRNVGIRHVTRKNWKSIISLFQTQRQSFHPVTVLPVPEAYAISPEYWDIYSRSEYLAHEVAHLITRDTKNDQFIFADAPFDGLTNDGPTFRELEKMGFLPQLDRSLFLAMVQNQKSLHQIFGNQSGAYTSFGRSVFKDYMNSDQLGRYSENHEDWVRNFERKKSYFLSNKRNKRRL